MENIDAVDSASARPALDFKDGRSIGGLLDGAVRVMPPIKISSPRSIKLDLGPIGGSTKRMRSVDDPEAATMSSEAMKNARKTRKTRKPRRN
jgi:hypothetical protein